MSQIALKLAYSRPPNVEFQKFSHAGVTPPTLLQGQGNGARRERGGNGKGRKGIG